MFGRRRDGYFNESHARVSVALPITHPFSYSIHTQTRGHSGDRRQAERQMAEHTLIVATMMQILFDFSQFSQALKRKNGTHRFIYLHCPNEDGGRQT